VQRNGSGPKLRAVAVYFDPQNDVALLRVPGLGVNPLGLAQSPARGTAGAILGYPLDGPFDARAARLGSRRVVVAEDAYGQGPRSRPITSLRGLVRSGNSGGPVVDGNGHVLTTVFAATVGGNVQGGYGVPNDVVRSALGRVNPNQPSGTGPCTR
jgi:S1-C subfamily serine protease